MTINNYKEILNISSSIWMGKGITGLQFKENLIVEKDIDPFIVREKYNNSSIGTTLTHTVVGYKIELLYHYTSLHGCLTHELVTAKDAQLYIENKITEYELVGIKNICNLYQAFVQTLIAHGVELKINQYANNIETIGNLERGMGLLSQRGLSDQTQRSNTEITFNDPDIS